MPGIAGLGLVEMVAEGGQGLGPPGCGERVESDEQLAVAGADVADLAIEQDPALFARWRNGEEVKFDNARDWLAASPEGTRLDGLVAPTAVFDREVSGARLPRLHKHLCGYAHSRAGMNNIDFWESNGPVQVWGLLDRIIAETKEPWCSAWPCCVSAGWTSP